MTQENKKSFRESMNRLEEIVALLERNEIELEEAMHLFEEGLQLVNECDVQLNQFENKVAALLENYQKEEHKLT
ncbi:MAG: exodeoxyribonuclease VII small subunit [Erysipelotrichia bacterium]|nr:exodeoxyribonuclease VII small subunit [Erysipelotrichia bacterium]